MPTDVCVILILVDFAEESHPEVDLTAEKLVYHEDIFVEEMEPSCVSAVLFSRGFLSVADHDDIERVTKRKLKAKKLIEKVRPQPNKIQAFYQALNVTNCNAALQHIRDNVCQHHVCVPSEYTVSICNNTIY
jgi:hypothetical protein